MAIYQLMLIKFKHWKKADPWSRSPEYGPVWGLGDRQIIYFSLQKAIQIEVVLLWPMRRKLHWIKTLRAVFIPTLNMRADADQVLVDTPVKLALEVGQ